MLVETGMGNLESQRDMDMVITGEGFIGLSSVGPSGSELVRSVSLLSGIGW